MADDPWQQTGLFVRDWGLEFGVEGLPKWTLNPTIKPKTQA